MSSSPRVRRNLAAAAAGLFVVLGLAACSSSTAPKATGPAAIAGQLHDFMASKSNRVVAVSETLQAKNGSLQVYSGSGDLAGASGAWSITALPLRVTNTSFEEKVIDAGGTAYMRSASLRVVMPKADWVIMAGSLGALQNSALLPLAVNPLMVAASVAAAPGGHYSEIGTTSIDGVTDAGYTASVPAGVALHAIAAAGTPVAYQHLAAELLDGRTLRVEVYVSKSGTLGAFGFSCSAKLPDEAFTVLDYTTTQPPASQQPVAPTTGVVSLAKFIAALRYYDLHH
jgi:hypothetical protein